MLVFEVLVFQVLVLDPSFWDTQMFGKVLHIVQNFQQPLIHSVFCCMLDLMHWVGWFLILPDIFKFCRYSRTCAPKSKPPPHPLSVHSMADVLHVLHFKIAFACLRSCHVWPIFWALFIFNLDNYSVWCSFVFLLVWVTGSL